LPYPEKPVAWGAAFTRVAEEFSGPVLELDTLLSTLSAPPAGSGLLQSFVPPPRFADKRFDNYSPDPAHPSQRVALDRLRGLATELQSRGTPLTRVRRAFGRTPRGRGVYLDGGFGVGKTHLLSALWHASPAPRVYLSFDELVYTLGLLGIERTRAAFRGQRLAAVDEWELDDPGNLKLALAWLRGALADGIRVAVTSNTVPDELGRGRFSQKSFAAEIEELAGAFEVLRIEGEDFRHRHFEADTGREYFREPAQLEHEARVGGAGTLRVDFAALLAGLGTIHPIRYADLVGRLRRLLVRELAPIPHLPEGLRWVHFIDKLYDSAVPLTASSKVALGDLFPAGFLSGAYGKKFSRCLSRMEELLGEYDATPEVLPGSPSSLRSAAGVASVEPEQEQRAQDGADPPGRIVCAAADQKAEQDATDYRAEDAEQYGQKAPHRVAPRHDQPGEPAHDGSEDHPPQQ
jgi:cell division protein ZapE